MGWIRRNLFFTWKEQGRTQQFIVTLGGETVGNLLKRLNDDLQVNMAKGLQFVRFKLDTSNVRDHIIKGNWVEETLKFAWMKGNRPEESIANLGGRTLDELIERIASYIQENMEENRQFVKFELVEK